jgi:hypothetical protein
MSRISTALRMSMKVNIAVSEDLSSDMVCSEQVKEMLC